MALPLKNTVYDKIKESGSLTDIELSKALIKDGIAIADDRLNKLLLDLEIMGLVRVTWMTKDTRRIEAVDAGRDPDEAGAQSEDAAERSYEASFPGANNG